MNKCLFVWDFHGVLEKGNVNSVKELINLVLKEFNIDRQLSLKEAKQWYGVSWFDYFKLAYPAGGRKMWEEMVEKVLSYQGNGWKIVKKHMKPMDHATEVLSMTKEKGHDNIVLSNTAPDHIKSFVNVLNYSEYFNDLIGVDNHRKSRNRKDSHMAKGEALINFLKNKNYQRIVLIGDKKSDISAGKMCGAKTYLFVGPESNESPDESGADCIINDLRDILKEA